eukprot:6801578-Ditylum_brightwellii.AAC.1
MLAALRRYSAGQRLTSPSQLGNQFWKRKMEQFLKEGSNRKEFSMKMAFKAADVEKKFNVMRLRNFVIMMKKSNGDRVHHLSLKQMHQKNKKITKRV